MFYSAIELRQTEDSAMVAKIAAETIRAIYPRYYPAGAVEFFAELHSQMEVEKVKNREEIFLAAVQGEIVGTGSIRTVSYTHLLFHFQPLEQSEQHAGLTPCPETKVNQT